MVNGYAPTSLQEALTIRAAHAVIPYAGGTDLMVQGRKGVFLFLNKIDELRRVTVDDDYIRIGAGVTFTEAIAHPDVPALMKEAVSGIAAPAIRNAGTFGGNLGNASDKADSVLIEYVSDALIRLQSITGERLVPTDQFILSRGVNALHDDELIVEVLLPRAAFDAQYSYLKVGGRNALAISHIAFAGLYDSEGGRVSRLSAAVIADAGTVLRFRDLEQQLVGLSVDDARQQKEIFLSAFGERIVLGRGRVSGEYRKAVSLNLLRDFLDRFLG